MLFLLKAKERIKAAADYILKMNEYEGYCVEIGPYKRNRSTRQNKTMWMWYHVISKDTGIDPEDLHNEMKIKILGVEEKTYSGATYLMPKSTTGLSTTDMNKFLEAIQLLAVSLNIELPMPDDMKFIMGEK